jgi:glycosyltransferase involved in cell wall biosynthesis
MPDFSQSDFVASDARLMRTLLPMACDGVGPSETCLNLLRGAHNAQFPVELFANRCRTVERNVPMRVAVPAPLDHLPYRWTADIASRRIERMFLNAVTPDDIAYLWPSVSLETHRMLHAHGVPIVLEGINTRMASAKKILDAAYADFGIPPSHGITQARVDEEEEKYEYADAIFAPNGHVEAALKGSRLENRILASSYGVDTSRASPERESYKREGPLTFMFCGYACVRKGVHLLLEAWKHMPKTHKLQFVGRVEPVIAERYRALLASDQVELVGFVDNVHDWFAKADVFVFPSLEEGGPQVVYEAALHGGTDDRVAHGGRTARTCGRRADVRRSLRYPGVHRCHGAHGRVRRSEGKTRARGAPPGASVRLERRGCRPGPQGP